MSILWETYNIWLAAKIKKTKMNKDEVKIYGHKIVPEEGK